jgi:hypothetical protein
MSFIRFLLHSKIIEPEKIISVKEIQTQFKIVELFDHPIICKLADRLKSNMCMQPRNVFRSLSIFHTLNCIY